MSFRSRNMITGVLLLALLPGLRGLAGAVLFEAVLGDADGDDQVSLGEAQMVINNFLGASNVLSVQCPPDMVQVGSFCIDKYESSVWSTTDQALITQIKNGTATALDLQNGGAVQQGASSDNYTCANNGQDCNTIYAASLAGITPTRYTTWFRAQAACSNAGKRLPTNAEWQQAVRGTPDPGPDNGTTDCNTATFAVASTGARSSCVSAAGAFDMVGNLYEWVADWVPRSAACGTWGAGISPTGDSQCLAGAATTGEPGALLRGGIFVDGADAGPLNVNSGSSPSFSSAGVGFRCVR